ncbi:hypothetical protein WJX73_000561 [Symbiochloris irregularis]|uniref:Sugar phosphate transporter domain-containing protein n=1 Tax=Symbiochloris irregularis TaxID=706552 RepID=A0AAW1P5V9_9CHLO
MLLGTQLPPKSDRREHHPLQLQTFADETLLPGVVEEHSSAAMKTDTPATTTPLLLRIMLSASYVAIWIALSGTVILYNKWILSPAHFGFSYPISLTLWHMAFSSVLAFALVRSGVVPSANMSRETYVKAIVPIGALFAGTLWLSNAAYLYLSVSFIQMLKALMPVAVFGVGCGFGVESFSMTTLFNMLIVTLGVAIASYGELNFVLIGVLLQLTAVITESSRLTLVQILLQRKGTRLNPITTLYYIAPCSFAFLAVPWALLEARPLLADPTVNFNAAVFVSNAAAAFALNMAVFLLVGKTSALTMNIAGVIKDWMLIALSSLLFHAPISRLNLGGYLIAFGGVCWYNYSKLQGMKANSKSDAAKAEAAKAAAEDPETLPLKLDSSLTSKVSETNLRQMPLSRSPPQAEKP